jgi:hypothetical protein
MILKTKLMSRLTVERINSKQDFERKLNTVLGQLSRIYV